MERMSLELDGPWRFAVDREERGEARGWHSPEFRPESWLDVTVPSNWDTYLPELFGFAGHGWYRRSFSVPPSWSGSALRLRFEGANYETTVWVNGQMAGSHRGGFDPFELDVSQLVDRTGPNTLAVRVDNKPQVGRVPNSLAGWWNYGGIYRSVRLLALPVLRISNAFVQAMPAEGEVASLVIEVALVNEAAGSVDVVVSGEVEGPGRAGGLAGPLVVGATLRDEEIRLRLASTLRGARLWSPESPDLYRLRLTVRPAGAAGEDPTGEPLDALEVEFGIRAFEVRGTQLYLNGRQITLRGVNRHEEYSGSGRVDPGNQLESDLKLVKDLGGNTVRMHYQGHPDLYRLADRLGILLFCEIPTWQVGVRDVSEFSDRGVLETAETMLRTLIRETRNHPSVVIWSIGNECATDRDESRPFFAHLAEVARSLDRTRPIAYVSHRAPNEKCFDLVDLPCINRYFGLRAKELGDALDQVHALEPTKPLFVSEFGHEAIRGLRGEGYGTEDEQSMALERQLAVFAERREYIPGTLIWCLADYWHMPAPPEFRWLNRIYFCHGLTTLGREPKAAWATVRRLFREE